MNQSRKYLFPLGVGSLLIMSLTIADSQAWLPERSSSASRPARLNQAMIAEGERLVLMSCAHCHSNSDGRLAGQQLTNVSASLGRIVSANITNDSLQGIGAWSERQLITLLRTGIDPRGHKAHFIMPRYPLLADADMRAIIAFLRSNEYAVQATQNTGPSHKPSLLSRFIATFFIKRLPEPAGPIALPDTTKPIVYGRYLVNSRYQCFACHSANVQKANLLEPGQTKGYLAGGSKFDDDGKTIYSANLTPDLQTGLGQYTEDEFREVLRLGRKRTGQIIRPPMLPYQSLKNSEIHAVYMYLKSVPAVYHPVSP